MNRHTPADGAPRPRSSSGANTRPSISEIGGFQILEKIAQGGMGAVYKARQITLDRIVALKILPPSLAKDAQFIERFQREARASARLNHLHIVQGIDVGCDKGFHYFAMEYVEGRSLREILKERGVVGEEEAAGYIRQIAQALECSHQAGLVHRDIKPDNILVTSGGIAKLADLGLAKQVGEDSSLTRTGTSVGTPYYISPEQARGEKDVDIRSDLYSLGATWFHLVTGRVPFEGDTSAVIMVKHLNEAAPKACRVNPQVSEGASRLIERLMRKNREQRPESPTALLAQLEDLAQGRLSGTRTGPREPVSARRSANREPPHGRHELKPEPSGYGRARYLLGGGLAAAALAGVLFLMLRGEVRQAGEAPDAVRRAQAGPGEPSTPLHTSIPRPAPERRVLELPEAGARAAEVGRLWAEFREQEQNLTPGQLEERLEQLLKNASGTPLEGKTRDEAEAVRRRLQERRNAAQEAAWQEGSARADGLARAGDYDGALALLRAGGTPLAQDERARLKATALQQEAEELLKAGLLAASQASAAGDPARGLAALKPLESLKFAALAEPLAALKRRLEAEASAQRELARNKEEGELEARRAAQVKAFLEALLVPDWEAARAAAGKAQGDPFWKSAPGANESWGLLQAAGQAAATRRVAAFKELLGKHVDCQLKGQRIQGPVIRAEEETGKLYINLKLPGGGSAQYPIALEELPPSEQRRLLPPFLPEDKAGQVWAALGGLAGWARKGEPERQAALDETEKGLRAASGFPLAAALLQRLHALRVGEAEAAAELAWKDLAGSATALELDRKGAEGLKPRLEAFLTRHGGSGVAQRVAAEIEALKLKVAVALEVRNYRGVWTRLAPTVLGIDGKPSAFPRRLSDCGAAYDSKRRLCILYGDGNFENPRNEMWAYDPAGNQWHCLQEHLAQPPEGSRPAPYFAGGSTSLDCCYDPQRDLYWAFDGAGLWRYDPNRKSWSRLEGLTKGRDLRGLAYSPMLKTVVTLYGPLQIDRGAIQPLKKPPDIVEYGWQPSSAATNGFAGPDVTGRFLAFGGRNSQTTWVFDPAKAEWSALEPAPLSAPPGRSQGHLVYHSRLKVFVLFGGSALSGNSSVRCSDTWLFAPHLNRWLEIRTEEQPQNRANGGIWYDQAGDQVLLFNAGTTWSLKLAPAHDELAPAATNQPGPGTTAQQAAGEPGPATVQRLFKGKVEEYHPASRRIVLVYDFKGSLKDSEQRADWTDKVELFYNPVVSNVHKARFCGALELSFREFLSATAFTEPGHGGVLWQRGDSKWEARQTGLYRDDQKQKTYAQSYRHGHDRFRQEVPIPVQERPCLHQTRITGEGLLSYLAEGAALLEDKQAFQVAGLRPFLPTRNSIHAVRLSGTLERRWLEEQLGQGGK